MSADVSEEVGVVLEDGGGVDGNVRIGGVDDGVMDIDELGSEINVVVVGCVGYGVGVDRICDDNNVEVGLETHTELAAASLVTIDVGTDAVTTLVP